MLFQINLVYVLQFIEQKIKFVLLQISKIKLLSQSTKLGYILTYRARKTFFRQINISLLVPFCKINFGYFQRQVHHIVAFMLDNFDDFYLKSI